jgi:hypothetical protein
MPVQEGKATAPVVRTWHSDNHVPDGQDPLDAIAIVEPVVGEGLEVDTGAIRVSGDLAGDGLDGGSGVPLDVVTDGSTLEIATNQVRVKDLGIATGKLAASAVTTAKIADANVTADKIATSAVGNTMTGGAGTAIQRAAISGDVTIAAASNTAAITAGSIVSADFNSEAPTTWTPALTGTGWAIGNAGVGALYVKHGRMGVTSGGITFGSTTTFGTGHLGITGFPAAGTDVRVLLSLFDVSAGANLAGVGVIFSGLTQLFIYVQRASGAYTDLDQVTSTVPWTWANGDIISWFGPLITAS